MKVYFKQGWFGPSQVVQDPLRPKGMPISGTRYRKSLNKHDLRDVPDELRPFLPKSATVVESPEEAPAPAKETLADHDTERAGGEVAQRKIDEADAEFQKRFEERQAAGGKRGRR